MTKRIKVMLPIEKCPNCDSKNLDHYYYIDYHYSSGHYIEYEVWCFEKKCNMNLTISIKKQKTLTKEQAKKKENRWKKKYL